MSTVGYYPTQAPPPPPVQFPPRAPYAPVQATTASAPRGGGMVDTFMSGDMIDKAGTLAHLWNAGKTGIDGAHQVNPAFGQLWHALKGLKGNGIFNGLKGIVGATIPLMTRSALFEGAISVVTNGYKMATGRMGFGQFAGNVVGDTFCGLGGGAGAAIAGGIVAAVLPFGGFMGTVLMAIGGIAGYSVGSSMIRSTGIYGKVVGTVRGAMGG